MPCCMQTSCLQTAQQLFPSVGASWSMPGDPQEAQNASVVHSLCSASASLQAEPAQVHLSTSRIGLQPTNLQVSAHSIHLVCCFQDRGSARRIYPRSLNS